MEKQKNHLEGQLQQITEHCDTLTQRYEEASGNLQKLQELMKESDYDRHQLKGRNQILEQQVKFLYLYYLCRCMMVIKSRVSIIIHLSTE